MQTLFNLLLGTALSAVSVMSATAATVYVPGHRTAKGAYVAPYTKTVPAAPIPRGYSAYPNGRGYVAPYTGQAVPYGYRYPNAPGYVPGYAPGYVPNAPAPMPVVPAAPYYGR